MRQRLKRLYYFTFLTFSFRVIPNSDEDDENNTSIQAGNIQMLDDVVAKRINVSVNFRLTSVL